LACAEDQVEMVEFLLEEGLPLDARNHEGDTPIHVCAVSGSI